jgi:hypothetical protein
MNGYVAIVGAVLLAISLALTIYEKVPRVVAWLSALCALCALTAVPGWHVGIEHATSRGTGIAALATAYLVAVICFYTEAIHGHRTHALRTPAFGTLYGGAQLLVINQGTHFWATVWTALMGTATTVSSHPGKHTVTPVQPGLLWVGLGVVGVLVALVAAYRLGLLPQRRKTPAARFPAAASTTRRTPTTRSRSAASRTPSWPSS